MARVSRESLADALIAKCNLTADDIAGFDAKECSIDVWLLRHEMVSLDDVIEVLGRAYGLPAVRLDQEEIDASLGEQLPADMARNCGVLPLNLVDANTVRVAMVDPNDAMAEDFLHFSLGVPHIDKVVVSAFDLQQHFASLDALATRAFSSGVFACSSASESAFICGSRALIFLTMPPSCLSRRSLRLPKMLVSRLLSMGWTGSLTGCAPGRGSLGNSAGTTRRTGAGRPFVGRIV